MTPPKVGSRFDWAVPDSWHGSPGKLGGRGCRVLEFRIYGFGLVWFGIPGFRVRVSGFSKVFVGFRGGFCRALAGFLQDFMGRSARVLDRRVSRLIRAEFS